MKLLPKHITVLKAFVHAINLACLSWLVLAVLGDRLGADPIQALSHFTGKAALNMLIVTMLISPVARHFKQGMLVRARRMIGLYSFFWALLHLSVYAWLDLGLNLSLLGEELIKRPYLTIGAVSWLVLFALAITSTQKIQRKMGKRWQTLHNWVYLAVILSPIHYYWSVKSGITEPLIYILISLALLALRWKTFKRWVNHCMPARLQQS
ncbi:protein-methionine-sulfoxide reductase heme-binding subunit MsrQ [Vibrio sp. Of7-15]|uniref:protein-methionine-sulfoxide reductase heme-binding subunit MsrQ n=1 Tax=Vibrio sp. Of7-15 TaxID=2724879 RepID=UPI001EF262F8|nr:protein-methionine-sulfoxide reductase heme-binding subunit MsrQ [Vibrio sp. Of7-15]MCG7496509.1 protein-methionine-sulfoxide reductase heme-binding subunit MsrQ [Vibrio sp. Of7-15]